MRTHAHQAQMAKTDDTVLAALGREALYIRDIRKKMTDKRASQPAIFSSLARLVGAGLAVREEGPRPGYKGRGPEPTVFWRRV